MYQFRLILIMSVVGVSLFTLGCGSPSAVTQPKTQSTGDSNGGDTNAVGSVSEMGLGDVYYIDFDSSGGAVVDFSDGATGAEYALIVQTTGRSSSGVSIASGNISAGLSADFDSMLRRNEKRLADKETITGSPLLSKSVGKAVGDSGSFRVLSSIRSTSSSTQITATEKCEEDHVLVYVDDRVSESDLSASDILTLCGQFEYSASAEEAVLGTPSDINEDGHVVILITPAVNSLGASGGGIITGFFWAGDLFDNSSSNPASNEMEIVYILAPDPSGTYGTAITKEFAMSNLMSAVVPHELQHAISYNQHVLVNNASSEEDWLNEAISHFSEDIFGFGQENPSRVEVYFESPASISIAPYSSPDLGERGGVYLFMRYLYEQAGNPDGFLAALEDTTNTGINNLETAFAGSDASFDEWAEFMRRWSIAVVLTDTGVTTNSNYKYADRTWNSDTERWKGVCLICDAEDGRETVLSGPYTTELTGSAVSLSLSGTATAFYSISTPPSTITLSGDAGDGLQGVLIRVE